MKSSKANEIKGLFHEEYLYMDTFLASKLTSTKEVGFSVARRCSVEKVLLKISQNSQENTYARASSQKPQACNFIEKGTLAQVFCCEFCEISKNTFLTEHLRWLLLNGFGKVYPNISSFAQSHKRSSRLSMS